MPLPIPGSVFEFSVSEPGRGGRSDRASQSCAIDSNVSLHFQAKPLINDLVDLFRNFRQNCDWVGVEGSEAGREGDDECVKLFETEGAEGFCDHARRKPLEE